MPPLSNRSDMESEPLAEGSLEETLAEGFQKRRSGGDVSLEKMLAEGSRKMRSSRDGDGSFGDGDGRSFTSEDLHTCQELLQGPIKDGLYHLHPNASCSLNPQALLSTSDSTVLWHQRLGHASFFIVQCSLSSSISLNKDHTIHVCLACYMGKIVNCSFPPTMNKSSILFELVHTGIWGLAPITSYSGHLYYIHFFDDYSKYSWFFVMKNHSDVTQIFRAFRLQVENLYSYKLKNLQSDGAKKFFSHDFQNELQNNGIFHHISYPHTPQQNGTAKRKYRHIVDMGLTLLTHSHLPPKF
uniref:Uncharacterized protein LOC105052420 isoform X1 n=1 Tax=Elaeis guineensis var. tenera TaxID=51953 RepID=A0A8N4F121_ELAGV|nr:uncharacterized protein LOC105052420 isoform X1 [Elaeis guineensis]